MHVQQLMNSILQRYQINNRDLFHSAKYRNNALVFRLEEAKYFLTDFEVLYV